MPILLFVPMEGIDPDSVVRFQRAIAKLRKGVSLRTCSDTRQRKYVAALLFVQMMLSRYGLLQRSL